MVFGIILFLMVVPLHSEPNQEIQVRPDIFPHTLYAFWNNNLNQVPLFTQLCINSMRKSTKLSNWNFVLLSDQNVQGYLSEQSKQQMKFILSRKKEISIQNYADLVRIFVLRDNGGMWIDATSFFVQDLSWVEQIDKQLGIKNKISSEPDMIMFSQDQTFGGNMTIVFQQRIGKDVVLFPGLQIWCFIAKPRCKFMNDWVDNIVSIYEKGTEEEFIQMYINLGYKYKEETTPYFIYSNFQFQTLLQKKQREIQANRSAFKERYAVEYYNIWNFNANQTGYRLIYDSEWLNEFLIKKLFYSTIEDIKSSNNYPIYFLKFNSYYAKDTNSLIESFYKLRCLNAIEAIPEDSIVNQFLLKPNEETEFVKRLRDLQRRKKAGKDVDCAVLEPKTKTILAVSLLVGLLIFSYALFSLFRCLQRKNRKEENTQQFEM